jgi:hypothetical protein
MPLTLGRFWILDNEETGGLSMHTSLWSARRALRRRDTPALTSHNARPVGMHAASRALPGAEEA